MTKTYRHPRNLLITASGLLVFYSLVVAGSVAVAVVSPDGSFHRPALAAMFYGGFWFCWVLVSLYLLVSYFREWWKLSDEAVTVQRLLWLRSIRVAEVTAVRWYGYPAHGSVVLRGGGQKITLWLGSSPPDERAEISEFLRTRFPLEIQTGWDDYQTALAGKPRPAPPSRWVAVLCAVWLGACGGAFLYTWWVGLGTQFGLVGEMCLIAAAWYLLRAVKGPPLVIATPNS